MVGWSMATSTVVDAADIKVLSMSLMIFLYTEMGILGHVVSCNKIGSIPHFIQ